MVLGNGTVVRSTWNSLAYEEILVVACVVGPLVLVHVYPECRVYNAIMAVIKAVRMSRTPGVVRPKCRTIHPLKAPLFALIVQADPAGPFEAHGPGVHPFAHGLVQGEQKGVGLSVSGHGEGAAVFTTGRGRIAEGLLGAEGLVADSTEHCVTFRTRYWKRFCINNRLQRNRQEWHKNSTYNYIHLNRR